MCILCKDYILEKLTRKELLEGGLELLQTSKSEEEFEHISNRLEELLKEED